MDHKNLRLLSLVLVSVSLGGCVARRAKAAMATYSQVLKPGITRKEVEDYFRTNTISFSHGCCVSNERSVDDLIEIGTRHFPLPCGDSTYYVAFIFDEKTQHPPAGLPRANDQDTLRSVTTFGRVDDCF
jgi:hypothetical protein